MNFALIEQAGITQAEFGVLAGVCRATVNLWVNHKMKPNRYINEQVAAQLESLRRAIDAQLLPLSDDLPKTERAEAIRQILADA